MSAGIDKAFEIAVSAHKNQTDKAGKPYICHPMYIASMMSDEDAIIVSLLHDTVEDSDITLQYLKNAGFSEDITKAIDLLTHKDGEDYSEYIAKIKENDLAREVKLAELRHNSDLTRLNNITEKDIARAEKYLKAIEFLLK